MPAEVMNDVVQTSHLALKMLEVLYVQRGRLIRIGIVGPGCSLLYVKQGIHNVLDFGGKS